MRENQLPDVVRPLQVRQAAVLTVARNDDVVSTNPAIDHAHDYWTPLDRANPQTIVEVPDVVIT